MITIDTDTLSNDAQGRTMYGVFNLAEHGLTEWPRKIFVRTETGFTWPYILRSVDPSNTRATYDFGSFQVVLIDEEITDDRDTRF